VYPALSVLQALKNDAQPVLWVGGESGMEAGLVTRSGVPFTSIPAAGVHGVGLRSLPGNLWRLARGTLASRRILSEFRPDVLLFTGGYVAAPLAVTGRNIPSLVYCPDIEPAMALKFLARFADHIAVTMDESRAYFPASKPVTTTGYPLRPELTGWERNSARAHFDLSHDLPVLLVTGGSKGAQTINRAVEKILPELLSICQVLHLTGSVDWPAIQLTQVGLPPSLRQRYHAYEFLHDDMGAAMAAADLAISRAGASTLGEYPYFGLPAILVPYPYAWRYQKVNAAFLEKLGAAVLLPDENMATDLLPAIRELFVNTSRLRDMQTAMQGLAHPNAAQEIAGLVRELAGSRKEGA
jgi:UDP-N-acetylglucosamine--N-acetylmuramyl-(pentapeptide) pyrophosphoryl-undecaprenol N-acetylglucosamine transferase